MLNEANAGVVVGIRKTLLQSLLAVGEGPCAQILAALKQKIEGEIDEQIGLALGKSPLGEPQNPGAPFSSRAHISPSMIASGKLPCGSRDGRIFGGPIRSPAGLQSHLAVQHTHLDAVAVES